jgi:hypothetical protein
VDSVTTSTASPLSSSVSTVTSSSTEETDSRKQALRSFERRK